LITLGLLCARTLDAQEVMLPGLRRALAQPVAAILTAPQTGSRPMRALIFEHERDTLLLALRPHGFGQSDGPNDLLRIATRDVARLSVLVPTSRTAAALRGAGRGAAVGLIAAPLMGLGMAVLGAGADPHAPRRVFNQTMRITFGSCVALAAIVDGVSAAPTRWRDVPLPR
jgi:hypothetical protein